VRQKNMGKNSNMPAEGHVSGQSNQPLSRPAHALTYRKVEEELSAHAMDGLSVAEATTRLEKFGRNDLGDADGVQPIQIVIAQIANAMTMVLILAMAVSYGFQSWIEGGVITFVIMLNVVVGFFQEYSAEKTMDSLRSLSSPTGAVVRGGESMVIPSGEIVPGDLVEIKTGDTVPADVRYVHLPIPTNPARGGPAVALKGACRRPHGAAPSAAVGPTECVLECVLGGTSRKRKEEEPVTIRPRLIDSLPG
jgi:magnesium-transporting ATPase (P-type)